MSVTTVCKDISELTAAAQKACRLFLTECERRGLKVRITETYRSQERQNYLYEQGRTRPGKVVTWTHNSRHTSRRAWDICQNVRGQEYVSKAFFKACGDVAKKYGITWGGLWSTPDTPHFEIPKNWNYTEGADEEMTAGEKAKMTELENRIAELEKNREKVYHYFNELPQYAYDTVKKLWDRGIYKGVSASDLNLPESLMRQMVMNDRAGLYE